MSGEGPLTAPPQEQSRVVDDATGFTSVAPSRLPGLIAHASFAGSTQRVTPD